MLLSFEGTVSLYQGEELGQLETELGLEEILDPQGHAFWPDDKGRDGCRTPMTWIADAPHAGFSTAATTWLPVKLPQRQRAADRHEEKDSVLSTYRQLISLRRKYEELRTGATRFIRSDANILAFWRGETMLVAFNLSPQVATMELPASLTPLLSQACSSVANTVELGPNGYFIGTTTTKNAV